MDDVVLVCELEGGGHLLRDLQCLRYPEWTGGETLVEILAIHQLHHERGRTAGFLEPMDVRDIRMIERRQQLGFALETRKSIRIGADAVR